MPTEINGTTGVSQVQAGATSGGLPVFQCRAWVNFDGTRDSTGALSTANTARLIRGSGNVSSVVRNGTGDYTVNFTAPMPDANYSVAGIAQASTNNSNTVLIKHFDFAYTAAAARIRTVNAGVGFSDSSEATVAIFR